MKKILTCSAIILLFCANTNAQSDCGTRLKESEKESYNRILAAARLLQQQGPEAVTYYHIRVFIHDFISNDATDSAWTYNEIISEFNQASNFFSQYNMCLVLAGIDYPRNTAFKDNFSTSNFNSLLPLAHSYTIDLTLHKILMEGADTLNGNAYTIPSKWFSLSRGAIGQRSFAHELGHCLGLLHTFETAFGLECPDGSNASSSGDKIPDTRATPATDSILNANTNASCLYTGNQGMICNLNNFQLYNPEIINLMSYGKRTCRSAFTDGQVAVMNASLVGIVELQQTWFAPPSFTLIAPLVGTIILDGDSYVSGLTVQIGNNNSSINVFIGGTNAIQRIISPSQIVIKPGVRLLQPTNERGKILIRPSGYCQE
ncbi:MAG: M43 family zinc metalloprotease [Chitinophagaceae bacterium]